MEEGREGGKEGEREGEGGSRKEKERVAVQKHIVGGCAYMEILYWWH